MKKGIELNGLANIKALIYMNRDKLPDNFIMALEEQVDTLKKYMIAVSKNPNNPPYWHEVRDNKENFSEEV